jgi:hypothetical protein
MTDSEDTKRRGTVGLREREKIPAVVNENYSSPSEE